MRTGLQPKFTIVDEQFDYDKVLEEHTRLIVREMNKIHHAKQKVRKTKRKSARASRKKNRG